VGINKAAIDASDAVIMASETLHPELEKHFNAVEKPKLGYQAPEDYVNAYSKFYDQILETEKVIQA